MLSWNRLRVAVPLTAVALVGALAGTPSAAAAPSAAAKQGVPAVGGSSAITVRVATTEQVRAIAAAQGGQLLTFGTDQKTIQVTCTLYIGIPYGGGAHDADILVYGQVTCDDYVHVAVLTVELYRGVDRVANTTATYPYVYGAAATAGVPNCNEGVYYGIGGVTVARYDLTPPSATATIVGYPVYISCAAAPNPNPQPQPLVVNNPGNRQSLDTATVSLQMTATGGTTPYTWSASGLPTGLSINSSTGLISGTTRIAGGYMVTVTATDAAGRTASTQFTWAVKRDGCARC